MVITKLRGSAAKEKTMDDEPDLRQYEEEMLVEDNYHDIDDVEEDDFSWLDLPEGD